MNTNTNFILMNEVDSTNNYANQLVKSEQAVHGTVVLAHYQQKGRGQAGNRWESNFGENLLASFILFPGFLDAARQFYLSKIVSLALAEYVRTESDEVSIKWPNDIYIGNKKVAGILIENSVKGNKISSSIAGVGLNLNQRQFLSDAPNPVSLTQITGKKYDPAEIARLVWINLDYWYQQLENGFYDKTDDSYFNQLFRANQWGVYMANGKRFEGKITGIGEFGQLIVQKRDSSKSEYMFKEIEFVI